MFNYETIQNLSPDDVIIINDLVVLAEKAKEIEQKIRENFTFKMGEDKIELWHDEYNHEYLTHDGVWQARYLHQTYDVKCTAEEIFEYMKAEYLIDKGFVPEIKESRFTAEGAKRQIYRYFSSFVNKLEVK